MELLARLERLPRSAVQRKILTQGGLGYMFDSMDSGMVAFVLPVITATWALSSGQTGVLGSALYIGYMFGALCAGLLGDRFGRRRVMMYALGIYTLSSLVAACAPTWEFMFAFRVIGGFGTGAESAIIAPYVAEFFAARYRGRYLGLLSAFFAYGFILASVIGYLVVPAFDAGWRVVQVVTAVPIVLLLWWRRGLRESPRFLIARGRFDEAERVVAGLEADVRAATGRELPPVDPLAGQVRGPGPAGASDRKSIMQTARALWGPKMARTTALSWVVWITTNYCYYGFLTFIPTLLVNEGFSLTRSFGYSIFVYVMQLPGVFGLSYLADRMERKTALLIFGAGAILGAGWLALAGGPVSILVASGVLSMFMKGVFALLYIYTPEVYPSAIRASGMGAASAVGRVGSIAAPLVIGFSYPHLGFAGVFAVTAGVLLLGVLAVVAQGRSTTGRALEEISEGAPPLTRRSER
ncbi:MFS transporter [Pseudonocardia acaciae]|uniref:MFS transporter n=1 Tax=Pseudonocardia acaciae TaxID=551276 RepID=UPI00048FA5FD|nr:MFS transporter [Pseudonocardia acaciae]